MIPISLPGASDMLLGDIDKNSRSPVYRQICDRVVSLILQGVLKPGSRLPSTRSLAVTLGVHRSTVIRSYEEIRALGYLESRCGSYTTVRRRSRSPTALAGKCRIESKSEQGIDWSTLLGSDVCESGADGVPVSKDCIDFERLAADPRLAPLDDLKRVAHRALMDNQGQALDYADAGGFGPLRKLISERMELHGVSVSSDEILVTAGAQSAIDLLFRLLVKPGDSVIVESPSYGMAHELVCLHGAKPLEIEMNPDGMDLDKLAGVIAENHSKLLYTMPNFHNPTGITTDQAHRERLLALCEQHRLPIIEDGFEEELKYFHKAVLPIKSMDTKGIVLYVGTFSKVVFPGLRVGWVAAPREVVLRLSHLQHATCLSGNTLAQIIAGLFCAGGRFETYLRRIHRVYRRRMQIMLQGLDLYMPPGVVWTKPSGGYTVWLTLPQKSLSEQDVMRRMSSFGVKVAPGSRFYARPRSVVQFRLSIACVDEKQIITGCRRLGRALGGG